MKCRHTNAQALKFTGSRFLRCFLAAGNPYFLPWFRRVMGTESLSLHQFSLPLLFPDFGVHGRGELGLGQNLGESESASLVFVIFIQVFLHCPSIGSLAHRFLHRRSRRSRWRQAGRFAEAVRARAWKPCFRAGRRQLFWLSVCPFFLGGFCILNP